MVGMQLDLQQRRNCTPELEEVPARVLEQRAPAAGEEAVQVPAPEQGQQHLELELDLGTRIQDLAAARSGLEVLAAQHSGNRLLLETLDQVE